MHRKTMIKAVSIMAILVCTTLIGSTSFAANKVLKIGFVGVTSGPAAAWGISIDTDPIG